MEWTDDAIVLSSRRYGETGIIAGSADPRSWPPSRAGARQHDARAAAARQRPVVCTWRARLAEQSGQLHRANWRGRAPGALMDSREALTGLNAFTAVAERGAAGAPGPCAGCSMAREILLDAMMAEDFAHWGPLYVRWEAGLLEALGFGLDLSRMRRHRRDRRSDLCLAAHRPRRVARRRRGSMPARLLRAAARSCWCAADAPDLRGDRAPD